MKKLTLLSLVASCALYAGGYKIPETSVNGMALSAANVAHSKGADAAYYNPANMAFMTNKNSLELDLIYIGLDPVNYKGSGAHEGVDIDAKTETFFIPSFNYVSPEINNFRFGLSTVVPGGLTKRWTDSPAVDKAEEFALTVIEFNPTVAYKINETLSVALGARVIYSEGVVKSSSAVSRDMTGDSIDYGYNLALSYKPTTALEIGVTYRSNVDLTEEGSAKLYSPTGLAYDGGATVTVPLPALLNIAVAYTFETKTTVEFVYERNFWSTYEDLDFGYASNVGNLTPYFDDPIAKDWKDVNAYRVGVTQEMDGYTLMAGFVIDKTPVPDEKISFELPDSDSVSVSFGARYQIDESWNAGAAMLYSMRDERKVDNEEVEGEFSNSNVLLMSVGVGYTF